MRSWESPLESRMREISHLHLTHFVRHLLDQADRLAMANGVELRVPFLDHELIEFVYGIPWSMKTFDGREKSCFDPSLDPFYRTKCCGEKRADTRCLPIPTTRARSKGGLPSCSTREITSFGK